MTELAVLPTARDAGPIERSEATSPRDRVGRAARFLATRPGLVVSVVYLALVLCAAFAPRVLAPGNPLTGIPAQRLRAPDLTHLFGTDYLGRDVFTRVVHGASLSLRATVIAVAIGLVVGGLIGLLAGFVGRWVDEGLMRVVDVLLSIPPILLSLTLITALGYGTGKVAVAVGVAGVAGFARVMRAETLRIRQSEFVEAARSLGTRWYTTLWRHVLPNAVGPVLVLAVLEFGLAILQVSSLSFLGYGTPPPAPEWGALIADGRNYLARSWWLCAMPGFAIAATVLAVNRVSRAIDGEWGRFR
ncbi:ABC transporter permease [Pseudonocardia spinosispora]|uniref:ABC transporter permease n=1 Tax=Pseudonocardia spinosispora TaxID=103441 RepID=UPI0004295E7A|nr:ABC transporter permease [Pseudonocardia spinosispora]